MRADRLVLLLPTLLLVISPGAVRAQHDHSHHHEMSSELAEPPEETLPEGPGPTEAWYAAPYNGVMPLWRREAAIDFDAIQADMMMFEVTRYPGMEPTPEQRAAADALRAGVRAAVEANGWWDFEKASADGFVPTPTDEAHYWNPDLVGDGRMLDPEAPEFLIFYETKLGKQLAGVMFFVEEEGQRGPQIGGPLTLWHYHIWRLPRCLESGLQIVEMARPDGSCAEGEASRKSAEMLHVWLIDREQGPFATDMGLDEYQKRQLEARGY